MADIFPGIGNMGYNMAGNVRKKMSATATLHIYDISRAACERFSSEFGSFGKISIAASSKEVAERCSTVISIVPNGDNVRQVYLDEANGVIAAPANAERLLLECSTIDAATAREVAPKLDAAGVGIYVDTPVSGGVAGAAAGTLAFMCGRPGPKDADPVARRIYDTVCFMGLPERINFCGGLGAGLTSKIVNNYLAIVNTASIAEAMAFGIRQGVDRNILHKCIQASSGASWILDHNQPAPDVVPSASSSHGFKPTFLPKLAVKDISLGIDAANEVGIDAATGKAALKQHQKAANDPRTAVSNQLLSDMEMKTKLLLIMCRTSRIWT